VKSRYESTVLQHSGIRLIEPALFKGYDPHKKTFFHEVVVVHDLEPIDVASREEAENFKVCLPSPTVWIPSGIT
jgi:fatty acid synthase subunit alpha